MEIAHKLRRLRENAPSSELKQIETLRQQLTVQLEVLGSFERAIGVEPSRLLDVVAGDDYDAFDKADDLYEGIIDEFGHNTTLPKTGAPHSFATADDTDLSAEEVPPEHRTISFPSNVCSIAGPSVQPRSMAQFHNIEVQFRCHRASVLLTKLRELIAERSFQFSHVQRNPPTKGVKTRSRTVTTNLRHKISMYAKMYTCNRARLCRLNVDANTLAIYKKLLPGDLISSTAVINANEPGSSTLILSWIWQVGSAEPDNSPEGVEECTLHIYVAESRLTSYSTATRS